MSKIKVYPLFISGEDMTGEVLRNLDFDDAVVFMRDDYVQLLFLKRKARAICARDLRRMQIRTQLDTDYIFVEEEIMKGCEKDEGI